MNFSRALPGLLLAAVLSAAPSMVEGGGELTLAGKAYRFQPTGLFVAPPKGGLPGAIRMTGDLIPASGEAPFQMALVFLRTGQLYLLDIHRGGKGRYPDSWAATQQTHLKVLSLQPRPGGRVEVACSGTLTGVVGQKPVQGRWSGRLWMVIPQDANGLK
jgi:hypothetical protein